MVAMTVLEAVAERRGSSSLPWGTNLTMEAVMKRILEIRAAEGGEDSKLFVNDLAQAYVRLAQRVG